MKAGGGYSSWKVFSTSTLRSSSDGPTIVTFKTRPPFGGPVSADHYALRPAAMAGDEERLYGDWVDTDFLREDIALSESVQAGLNSRGFPGGVVVGSGTFSRAST